jgi:hypothetical protein
MLVEATQTVCLYGHAGGSEQPRTIASHLAAPLDDLGGGAQGVQLLDGLHQRVLENSHQRLLQPLIGGLPRAMQE